MSFDLELAGRRALVTGGTKGVGVAVVDVLRGQGAKVIATARSMPEGSPDEWTTSPPISPRGTAVPPSPRQRCFALIEPLHSLDCETPNMGVRGSNPFGRATNNINELAKCFC